MLLIACANVANLLLVRGSSRRSELAVRAVLGAGHWRLVSQLMAESLVLAAMAGVFGVLLANWFVILLRQLAPAGIPRTAGVGLDATALLFAVCLVLLTSRERLSERSGGAPRLSAPWAYPAQGRELDPNENCHGIGTGSSRIFGAAWRGKNLYFVTLGSRPGAGTRQKEIRKALGNSV